MQIGYFDSASMYDELHWEVLDFSAPRRVE